MTPSHKRRLCTVTALASLSFTAFSAQQSSLSVADILNREGPSVVVIKTTDEQGAPVALATGIVIGPRTIGTVHWPYFAEIVTNLHVLEGACTVQVEMPSTGDTDTKRVTTIIGTDASTDLAILRIDGVTIRPAAVRPADRTSTHPAIGDHVVAIGNPVRPSIAPSSKGADPLQAPER